MMMKSLSFTEINPFVRYAHLERVLPGIHPTFVKAYDYRLFYLYDGKGSIVVQNEKFDTAKGSLLYFKPGTGYRIVSDKDDPLVFIGINFDFTLDKMKESVPVPPRKATAFEENEIIDLVHFTDMEIMNHPVHLKNMQVFESSLMEMVNEYSMKKLYYPQRINGLFLALIIEFARYACSQNTSPFTSLDTIDQILRFIHDNYDQQITNRDIGARFNFHANYINKLMVLHTGTSLHQYLINFRISKSIHLMQTTSRTISEIAYAVGFKDVNHFSKAFKKKMGESPKSFKSHAVFIV